MSDSIQEKGFPQVRDRVDGRVFYRLDGTIEYYDEGALELFEAQEAAQDRDTSVFPKIGVTVIDEDALMRRVRRLQKGEPKPGTFGIRRTDGTEQTIHVDYDPVHDGEVLVGFLANYTTITGEDAVEHDTPAEHLEFLGFQDVFMALDRGVVLFDSGLKCTLVNKEARALLALHRPEGRSSTDLWRAASFPDEHALDAALRRCLDTREQHASIHVLTRTAETQVSVEFHKGGHGVVCFVDEARTQRRLNHVELLARIGKLGTQQLGVETLSQSVMDGIFEFLDLDIVVIAISEAERLRPVAWQGLLLDANLVADPLMNFYVQQALSSGRPVAGDGSEWDGAPLTGSHIVVPLINNKRTIGTLHLGDIQGQRLDDLSDAFLSELGSYIASTIESTRSSAAHALERARLTALIKRMPEGVLLFNNRGEVLLSNDAAKDVLEVELKHLNLDRRPYRVLDRDSQPLPRAEWPFFRAARMSAGYIDVPIILEFEGSRTKFVNVTVLPIASNHGPSASFLGMLVDVTERTVQDQRKDEFLSVASHELRSPLTPLTGFLQLVQRQMERGEDVDQALVDRSLDQVRRLSRLIDVLLDMTRIETGRMILTPETVDICDVVERVAAGWEAHDKGVLVDTRFLTGPVVATVDVGRLDQVLTNLIDNAVKHTNPPGGVVVEVEQVGAVAHLRVTDEGRGIPADELKHVFDRFYQAQRSRRDSRSMGLGLYITQQIVHQHGGVLDIESEEGEGTQVHFTLPLETH